MTNSAAIVRKRIATAVEGIAFVAVASLLLFTQQLTASCGFLGNFAREVLAVLRDSGTQWMVFLCLAIYFGTFLLLRERGQSQSVQIVGGQPPSRLGGAVARRKSGRVVRPAFWLVGAVFISAVIYALDYSASTQALTFLAGTVIGQGVAVWAGLQSRKRKVESRIGFVSLVVVLFIVLLAVASFWRSAFSPGYEYHGQVRWSGPWTNPNIYGLLMGAGMVLAVGIGIRRWRMEDRRWKKSLCVALSSLAAILLARGFWHSYSRGAWVAAACGLAYLISEFGIRNSELSPFSWSSKNWLPLSVVALSVVVLGFWQFRQLDWLPARRAFSAANVNDFSWRNRVAAWEGTLQMMAEHSWLGLGWNQPERMYDNYYRPAKVEEAAAIQMNDYLTLGASLGIPALVCFCMYLWLSLFAGRARHSVRAATEKPNDGAQRTDAPYQQPSSILDLPSSAWLAATCRAGAIVLAVGFWFDGGLFKLATASTFWILLELGRADVIPQKATEATETKPAAA